ncbi:hypothetical protein L7F22_060708 [Adiantum nelumboides]|nr:hypothetical protein [Adiantum nelumboides]
MKYMQIVKQIREWWEKFEGLWKEWTAVINAVEEMKTVKEFRAAVGEFKAGMRFWKRHMHVLVKHTNALLQLNIVASKISKKEIENLASNEDTYRDIGEILFEARIKANQPEPAGWLATASHCHKLARARVTKRRKTLYYPDTKVWLPMTPYEQQMIIKESKMKKSRRARWLNCKFSTSRSAELPKHSSILFGLPTSSLRSFLRVMANFEEVNVAVIMVGGPTKGTRFRPLSLNLAKPLFPLAGHAMVHHPILACKKIPNLAHIYLIGFYEEKEFTLYVSAVSNELKVPVSTIPHAAPSTHVGIPQDTKQIVEEPVGVLTRSQRAALGLELPECPPGTSEVQTSTIHKRNKEIQQDPMISDIDGAFLEAIADLQQLPLPMQESSSKGKLSAEFLLKNTFQQVSLYDMLKIDAEFRGDTLAIIQSLYPGASTSGGHLPVQPSETYMISQMAAPPSAAI